MRLQSLCAAALVSSAYPVLLTLPLVPAGAAWGVGGAFPGQATQRFLVGRGVMPPLYCCPLEVQVSPGEKSLGPRGAKGLPRPDHLL